MKNKNNLKEKKVNNVFSKINSKKLDNIISEFKKDDINVKIDKNCIKIIISSDDDLDKLAKYFR